MELIEYRRRIIINEPHIKKAEGNILTFNTDIINPLKVCKVNFNPIQSGEGDPSPTNIRPISGWNRMYLHKTGKNLLGGSDFIAELDKNNFPYTETDYGFSFKASNVSGQPIVTGIFKENTRYTFIIDMNRNNSTGQSNFQIKYTDGTYTRISNPGTTHNQFVTVSAEGKTVTGLYGHYSAGYTYVYTATSGIFEGVCTINDYEPYIGILYDVTFPDGDTVYGGTLDLLTGVLTVEYEIYDIGSLTWEVANGSGEIKYFRSSVLTGMKKIASTDIVANIYCSILKTVSAASIYFGLADDNSIGQDDSSNAKIRVKATSYNDDATAFKTAMSGVMLVYELATPQTFQLTPQQITTLKSINNIWADTGETRIAYWSH